PATAQQYLPGDQPRQAQRRQRNATRVDVQIPTPDGHSNGTLHVPDGDGPWPGVLVFPDASGAPETIRQTGDQLAGIGHVALIPDSYHRAGQRAPFDVATLFTDEPLLLL